MWRDGWNWMIKNIPIKKKPLKRRMRNKVIELTIVIVIVLLGSSGIGGFVWYNWDSDGDGIRNRDDIFPHNADYHSFSDLKFQWATIPPGSFMMGSPEDEGHYDEHPQHQVTITREFQMLIYEVTQAQWEAVMGNIPSFFSGEDDRPVESVSWNDSQLFVSKLNRLDSSHTYRLPTEAEWEYACRAGTNTNFSFGDDEDQLDQYAWYSKNTNGAGEPWPHRVGLKLPNAWGLYDMHGNVREWCKDLYDDDYDEASDTDPQGHNYGSMYVFRGGHNSAKGCRSADRGYGRPDKTDDFLGLRLVRVQD